MKIYRTLQQITLVLEEYYIKNGYYPDSKEGLKLLFQEDFIDPWESKIIFFSDGQNYLLISKGPDKVISNDDIIFYKVIGESLGVFPSVKELRKMEKEEMEKRRRR